MRELLLALDLGDDTARDLTVRFDERATVGQLADRLTTELRPDRGGALTLRRRSRHPGELAREQQLSRADLRSGDLVDLAVDTGTTADGPREVVGRVRVQRPGAVAQVVDLHVGEVVIGRAAACDLPIDDDLASRRHAKLRVREVVEVVDLGATNGTTVNGTELVAPRRLRVGDRVGIGDTVLTVEQAEAAESIADVTGNTVEFNRPPRLTTDHEGIEVELPAPPDPAPRQRLPMISAVVPVLMGVVLWLFTRSIFSVLFLAMSPLMLLGSWWEGRRSGRAEHAERVRAHEEDVAALVEQLEEEREREIEARFAAAPAVGELDRHVRELSPRLWERQPDDDDFLHLRVGLAPLPSRSTVTVAEGGDRTRRGPLREIPERFRMLPPVPVTLDLRTEGNLGVAGPSPVVEHVARSLVAQACVLHSPSELHVAALLTERSAAGWRWLPWLPHTRAPRSPLGERHVAVTIDDHLDLVATLQQVLVDRERVRGSDDQPPATPLLIVVDDAIAVERPRLTALLERGPAVGLHLLWFAGTARRLPKPCRGVVDIDPSGAAATVRSVTRREEVTDVRLEPLDPAAATLLARDLAPVVDVSSDRSRDAGIPRQVAMVDLLGGADLLDDPAQIEARWGESVAQRESRGLRVPLGVAGSGPFAVDLRHDGPHALVAGTTGAGKSELLQSLLIGLAVTYPAERVTFLLVDYKGGAAFKECVKLPHTVGLVTDLTPALVRRALTSLRAELHRRERLLNRANAKDLMAMEAAGHPETPPSLLIVVDEFAALAREVPEFVEGVVDVAQRGRSLGLHLVLATQRPQGVVTPSIRANTNLKIALRVATEDESADVVDAPAAALIDRSLSGRAVARLGPSDLITFQTGYAGGHTEVVDDTPVLEVGDLEVDRRRPWTDPTVATASEPTVATDLERLVSTVRAAHAATGRAAPRRPWLDPLATGYDLLRLPHDGSDRALPIGVADEPQEQSQRLASFAPDRDGSLLIYGVGGSGKTVTLRTLAAAAALTDADHPVHVHGIDAAGRGLSLLEPLPNVGAIVPLDDHDRLVRLILDLEELVEARTEALGRFRAASLPELRRNGGAEHAQAHRVLVLVDGFEQLQATYEHVDRGRWFDSLLRMAADGRAAGVHLALTGSRRTAFPTVLTSTVGRRLVLRLATTDEYMMLGADPGLVDGDEPPGRAIDGDGLTQVALVGPHADTAGQAGSLRELGAHLAADGGTVAADVAVLPPAIPAAEVVGGDAEGLVVGLDDRLDPFVLPIDEHVLVAAPPRAGRSTAIATIAQAAVSAGHPVIAVSGRRPTPWLPAAVRSVVGAEEAARLFAEVPAGHLVLIDQLETLLDGPADTALELLLDQDRATVIAACETATARRYSMTLGRLRRTGRVALLQPDVDLDSDLAGAPLPRTSRPLPPGRGLWCDGGRLRTVQFATADTALTADAG